MAEQQPRQQRTDYGYPSPQMASHSSYAYPPQQGQSPHLPLPPLNLPPIRDQTQPGEGPMGSPLPPPQHGMPQYYAHPAHPPPGQAMNMGSQLAMGSVRYQLPPQSGDQRVLSGGRHKKEIKRRTKTGCLTCRKRRIKCDEAHPSCRNCAKSKRDCLGYDPIFKPQPGPPQIQPAPNSAPHQTSSPAPAPPTTASYSAQVPQGYAPAATAGYPPPPPASASIHPQHENFNSSAIDPALAAADPAMHGQAPYNGVHALNPALRGSPYSSAASDAQPLKGKPLNISDIFSIAHHNPPEVPARPTPIPPELDDEFATIFAKDYCIGLDVMLETKWFSTNNNALNRLFANRALHEEAVFFTETVKYRTSASDMSGVFSQEARLIWHMLASCKHPDPALNGTNGAAAVDNDDLALKEVRARFDILEALLTNQNMESNSLRQLSYPQDIPEMKRAELEFWEQLGEFVVHADSDSAPPGASDYALGRMRSVLNAHEVRDAIYSIAIARHAGNRVRGFPNALPAVVDQNPESDLTKLNVAMSFISHECRSGTQQVIARVCDMAMLSWTVSRSS
ncbi:hypothetical protein K458DRAFT_297967 [Lentithecium fluviatile CBS 122367]|uniref:Zn(2)-C6 fungal-type domain-containing protein n=1 Tax=Lentithecium fluviatile CBS 122367 TaxID=1168545 RepID=A0A6G1J8N3_9PLEO|nr:hypothetical protein K458DRAFT_297967 [Lentithecium fluviatile CBS 122367]